VTGETVEMKGKTLAPFSPIVTKCCQFGSNCLNYFCYRLSAISLYPFLTPSDYKNYDLRVNRKPPLSWKIFGRFKASKKDFTEDSGIVRATPATFTAYKNNSLIVKRNLTKRGNIWR